MVTFELTAPVGGLDLVRYAGEEELSSLFQFRLTMKSQDADIDFDAVLGQAMQIAVYDSTVGSEPVRYIHGIVSRFVQARTTRRRTTYRAVVSPSLWLLGLSTDCRVFQELSVPQILQQIFDEQGLADYRFELTASYEPRDYCVQYNETTLDFVSRLLEDEGIHYFFDHSVDGHTLVLADDPSAWTPFADPDTLEYNTKATEGNTIPSCRFRQRLISGRYGLDDYNFEMPQSDLSASASSALAIDGDKREVHRYPGGFDTRSAGEQVVRLRKETHETRQQRLEGTANSAALVPGYTFTLAGHERQELDTDWCLSRVQQEAGDGYTCSFAAIPVSRPYRAPLRTRRPRIAGSQTAVVVGASGEEIWPDEYGRVKVQFHWDRRGKHDEDSSGWIRVAQGWAGKGFGQMFLPRIGQEVVVSFLEGDPDRPLITGAVYNADQNPPYPLPDDKTRSTVRSNSSKGGGGFNELRFEDKAGSEEVYLHAERNRTLEIGADETHTVGGVRSLTVDGAESRANRADFTHEIDGKAILQVDGDLVIQATGSIQISGRSVDITAESKMDLEAGATMTVQGSLVKIN